MNTAFKLLQKKVLQCRACPRLVKWREKVADMKKPEFAHDLYWGKPVPSFGHPKASIWIVGLAPAAHGANRTGRMFTGDRSGQWLYRAMHKAGLANQPNSIHRKDGLRLKGAFVTAIVRCAPPKNRPKPRERDQCLDYLVSELNLAKPSRVLICLGGFAWDGVLRALARLGHSTKPKPRFSHGVKAKIGPHTLLGSYHPSQQNTFTGKLTEPMLDQIFQKAKTLARE